MVSSNNYCAHVLDLSVLDMLAARTVTPTDGRETRESPGEMRSATAYLGCQIPIDKPAPHLYTRLTSPIFAGSSHLCLW